MHNPVSLAKLYNMHLVRTLVLLSLMFDGLFCVAYVLRHLNIHGKYSHTPVPHIGHRKMVYTRLEY